MSTHIDRWIHIDWWTGQYPILAYTTLRDLNQSHSQPHISIRGITIVYTTVYGEFMQLLTALSHCVIDILSYLW